MPIAFLLLKAQKKSVFLFKEVKEFFLIFKNRIPILLQKHKNRQNVMNPGSIILFLLQF